MGSQEFRNAIARHLEVRGASSDVAEHIAMWLDDFLDFKVEESPIGDFDAYICFAFGNEPDEFANLHPGELNEILARVVKEKYRHARKPIIAQWEIGELLKDVPQIEPNDIESHGQDFDKVLGRPVYQSTRSFLEKVAAKRREKPVKRLLVVAQWFHYARCVKEVERAGFEPVVDQDAMPKNFCTENFGQLWTSSEERFVLNTLIGSLNRYREEQNKKWQEQTHVGDGGAN